MIGVFKGVFSGLDWSGGFLFYAGCTRWAFACVRTLAGVDIRFWGPCRGLSGVRADGGEVVDGARVVVGVWGVGGYAA